MPSRRAWAAYLVSKPWMATSSAFEGEAGLNDRSVYVTFGESTLKNQRGLASL